MNKFRFLRRLISVALILGLLCSYSGTGLTVASSTGQSADHVVINQVFGGGGKSDSRVSHSFIELYNPTNQDVDMSGWKIEYNNDGDGSNGSIILNVTLPAGDKYFIKGMMETQSDPLFPIVRFTEDSTDCDLFIYDFVLGNKNCQITLYDSAKTVVDGFGRGSLTSVESEGGFAVSSGNKHTIYARTNGIDSNSLTDFTSYNFNSDGESVLQAYKEAGLFLGQDTEVTVFRFASEYAKVGEPLVVSVTGGNSDNYTYLWKVDSVSIPGTTSNSYIPKTTDVQKWISVDIKDNANVTVASLKMYCSNLPVIYLDTEGGAEIVSKDEYINANIKIQGNDIYNSETTTLYEGVTEIKGRGNSTWFGAKKPYKLKLDSKTDLFGMGANKHWNLIANYYDRSLLRDKIAYDFSDAIGAEVYMESTWVDLILNGEYVGNYRLTEHIRVSPERVNIYNWEDAAEDAAKAIYKAGELTKDQRDELIDIMTEDLSWITTDEITYEGVTYTVSDYFDYPENTGGILLDLDLYEDGEFSTFTTDLGQVIRIRKPEFAGTNDEMMQSAKEQVNAFGRAAFSNTHYTELNGEKIHYSEIFDMDSLLTYFMVTELFNNYETGRKSTFFYKDIDSLFKMGPIWDMDWSADGWAGSASAYDIWQCTAHSINTWWYRGICSDPYFIARAQEMYWNLRDEYENIIKTNGIISSHYEYLKESAHADNERWEYENTFEFEVRKLKTWLTNRINWFDEQYASLDTTIDSIDKYEASKYIKVNFLNSDNISLPVDTTSEKSPADAYSDNKTVIVSADVTRLNIKTVEFYVNGIFAGTASVAGKKASITLNAEDLDSEHINVVEVMGYEAGKSEPSEKNYGTLRQANLATDKTVLAELIETARGEKQSDYTDEGWSNLQTKLDEAVIIYEKDEATQIEIDEAAAALREAIKNVVYGDVNHDGEIDDIDVMLLTRYLANWDIDIDLKASDINGDNTVDDVDVMLFERYLANWDVETKIEN